MGQREMLFNRLKFLMDRILNLATKHVLKLLLLSKNKFHVSLKTFSETKPGIEPTINKLFLQR